MIVLVKWWLEGILELADDCTEKDIEDEVKDAVLGSGIIEINWERIGE
jgi:hypothetical protein